MRRAVFLDRDGVLLRAVVRDGLPYSARGAADFELLPGVEAACEALREASLLLVVVTNQPEVARGTLDPRELELLHNRLRQAVPLDDIVVCPHDDADACACRKPKPGMLLDAADRLGIDISASFLVGDRWRDVEAGKRAGCRVAFVDRGWAEELRAEPDIVVGDLAAAAEWILAMC